MAHALVRSRSGSMIAHFPSVAKPPIRSLGDFSEAVQACRWTGVQTMPNSRPAGAIVGDGQDETRGGSPSARAGRLFRHFPAVRANSGWTWRGDSQRILRRSEEELNSFEVAPCGPE